MTRKDYVLIAAVLKAARDDHDQTDVHKRLAVHFAYALEQESGRFDRDRFLKAAGHA